jgi:predicted permease
MWIASLSLSSLESLLSLGTLGIGRPPMDARTLLLAIGISMATGLLVGIVPALRATGGGPASVLGAGRQVGQHRHSARLRGTFVVAQVALSVVLLAAFALIIGNIVGLTPRDLGFNPDGVFTARVMLAPPRYAEPTQRQEFCESVLSDIARLPGVRSVGAINKIPIANPWQDWGIWPAGRRPATPAEGFSVMARWVTPGYFDAMGIPLRAGRDISPRDTPGTRQVIVLSERTAQRLFPGQNPIGRIVEVWSTTGTYEVVGVVGDARLNVVLDDATPAMYMSSAQAGSIASRIVVRTSGDPHQLAGPLREIVRRRDRGVPLVEPASMTAIVDQGLSVFRVIGLVLGIYAGVAILLTAIGLYGTLAYHVGQQEGEMGIRLAMGATPTGLLCRVLLRGLALAGSGVLVGATVAIPAIRLLDRLPFTLQPVGPSSHAMVLAVLAVAALMACVLPAWRVTRINPVDALRKE